MEVHVVYNPTAGTGAAPAILEEFVRPRLLSWLGKHIANPEISTHETHSAESAGEIGTKIGSSSASVLTIVVIGGDGTAHELLDGIVSAERNDATRPRHEVQLVIVPTGTANALFHSLFGPGAGENGLSDEERLFGLDSLIEGGNPEHLRPVTLLGVQHSNEPDAQTHHGLVISSHALHAAIVRDSEALRKEIPDVSRFKVAAKQNAQRWSEATLRLDGHVQRYEPKSGSFVSVKDLSGYEPNEDGSLVIEGPFAYMNAMVIDRLERDFVPATFASNTDEELARPPELIDIIVIRPSRSRAVREALNEKKPLDEVSASFATDVLMPTLLGGMYDKGSHVNSVYKDADGKPVEEDGEQVPIVEYFRASSYEWTAHNDQARTSCVDGSIYETQVTRTHVSNAVTVFAWADRSKYRA
ncbi:hypothetical protein MCUN1_002641 [Malassezia cuniculi]|uniref:DAGKc domain-containing protein n=1 Tax=Malassezia cuniculi TaxID=948313 RepID=A0AAF0EWD9_9BASI|nr:hypothetical protein MCUN1_002641 [Malassezia cuniculi]